MVAAPGAVAPGGSGGGGGGGGGCSSGDDAGNLTSNTVDLSTGLKVETATDISIDSPRGGLGLSRTYTTDFADSRRSPLTGRFGNGVKDNYDIRLTGTFEVGGAGRVVMPDEMTGRLFSYLRTDADGALVFATTGTAAQLGDVLRRLTDGTFEYRYADRRVLRFDSARQLVSNVDRNQNAITLTYSGANLTRITDPTGR